MIPPLRKKRKKNEPHTAHRRCNYQSHYKKKKLALGGGIGSFKIDFKPSAKGYNNPNDPTTLRPFQRYMEAMTLHSTDTGKATPGRNDMMIPKILARRQRIYSRGTSTTNPCLHI